MILNALGAGDFGIFNIVGGAIAMLTFLNTSMAAATQRFMYCCDFLVLHFLNIRIEAG